MGSFIEFVEIVDKQLKDLELEHPAQGTLEAYLINHLRKLSLNCHESSSAKEVSNSVKSLMHFATDSLEYDSVYAKNIFHISRYHSDLIRVGETSA